MEGLTAIILASTELGGMGEEYFQNKTRHLIPIVDKPLIFHLIDELIFNPRIKEIYIIIEEKIVGFERTLPCKESYLNIINSNKYYNEKIKICGQNFLTKMGTLEAVKSFFDENGEKLPLLVIYGDSYIKKDYLDRIVDEFYEMHEREADTPRIYWGATHGDGKGNILTKTLNDISEIDEAQKIILDIKENKIDSVNAINDTGIMIISERAWKIILTVINKIHRPSSSGIFSFANIIRQALIFRNTPVFGSDTTNINIHFVLGSKDHCCDANYPWEMLKLKDLILKDKLYEIAQSDNHAIILRDNDSLDDYLGQETVKILKGSKLRSQNNALLIGPCCLEKGVEINSNTTIENSFIGTNSILMEATNISNSKLSNAEISKGSTIKSSIIKDSRIDQNAIIKESFIGENCRINSNTFICNSTLEKNIIIHSGSIIKASIIMEKTNVFHNCLIVRSLIGKEVMLGVGVHIPCKRLGVFREGELIPQDVVYFADINILKTKKFGGIIGDKCQLGSGVTIHPGRRIGRRCIIKSGEQVTRNLPKDTKMS